MKYRIVLMMLILCHGLLSGQDLHFSQFYAAPLTVSPSYTGFFNDDFRIGANFKSQWPWAIKPATFNYRTFSGYADFAILEGILPSYDWMGIGFVTLNDRSGDGRLTVTKIFGSLAYHISIAGNKHFVSLGVSAGYVQKSIDYQRLYFDDQWDPNSFFFDNSVATAEPNDGNDIKYFSVAPGLNYSYFYSKNLNFTVGAAFFHLNKPKESFSGQNNQLGIRPVVNGKGYVQLSNKIHLEPAFIYVNQKKAQEIIINLLSGISIHSGPLQERIILVGASYRTKDAFIPVIGFQYKSLRVLANFDINLSSLTEASRANGGLEVSAVYTAAWKVKSNLRIPCPRL